MHLEVPLSIPVMGEAFVAVNNPVMLSTVNLFFESRIRSEPSESLELSFHSGRLRRSVARLMQGVLKGRFSVTVPALDDAEGDFIALASLFHVAGMENLDAILPRLLESADEKAFITISRALTSLYGGFVVCRKGEGAIPLEGCIDSPVVLKIKRRGVRLRGQIEQFSQSFPELSQPLWHALGHLVIEGGKAVRQRDAPMMGRLLTLESALAYSVGIVKLGELCRLSRFQGSLGWKAICSESITGELILASKETPEPPTYCRYGFTKEGIREVGHR